MSQKDITHDEVTKAEDIYTRIAALPDDVQITMKAIFNGYLIGYQLAAAQAESDPRA